jgi:hypothetical protein
LRAYYAPNVPVPVISDLQMYNREILRGRKITAIKSAKTTPVNTWLVMEDGKAALITDEGGRAAWSRLTCGAGSVVDTGAIPINGMSALRIVGIRTDDGIYIAAAAEYPGERGDVFLDLWREYNDAGLLSQYRQPAVVYDAASRRTAELAENPEPGPGKYIGYPYESRMRTLPRGALGPTRSARARLRLLESHLPYIRGYPGGMVNRLVHPLWNTDLNEVKDGVINAPVPGNVEQDAAFEVFTSEPGPLSIICLTEEGD